MNYENNYLKEEISKMIDLCHYSINEYGRCASYFGEGIPFEALTKWEELNKIELPRDYKEWLTFSKHTILQFDLAVIFPPQININEGQGSDLVVIGRVIGNGESICISKSNQKIIRFKDGIRKEYSSFKEFLNNFVIRMLISSLTDNDAIQKYDNYKFDDLLKCKSMEIKTRYFNKLVIEYRKKFLDYVKQISQEEYDNFIDDISRQSIIDFWWHERDLIQKGLSTRTWAPDQIENIMNINQDTGMCEKQAGRP